MNFNFKKSLPLEERKRQSDKIMKKYPDRLPIVLEKVPSSKLEIPREKYMVEKDITMGSFYQKIRKSINLRDQDAVFFFINNMIPSSSATMISIYEEHKDEDNFLYVSVSEESVYGL